MTNPDYTAIAVLIDRSGSMATIKRDAEGGLNSFVQEQAKLDGECTVRISQFDNQYESVTPSVPVKDVENIRIVPRGMTALNDALGRLITEFGEELAALPEDKRPGKVLFVTVTDGMENSSREWTAPKVKALVEKQTNDFNWQFVFLAAGQDAVLTGKDYGFSPDSTMTFAASSAGVANTSSILNAYATTYRGGGPARFTDEDRAAATQE